ncbi:MAG: YggT family protein [Gammaproteobacteria bacterium]|nr:YggT family protein [Gammaproteobacteria bacterium]MDH5511738.1 YggT family protein [Gammaproteobacteria bacterium]
MNSFFIEASTLIVEVVFGLYILAVLLRFLFQLARADFYNPISQFLVALTNPLLKPLRRIIPGLFGIDLASLVLLLALKCLELFILSWLIARTPDLLPLSLAAVLSLVRLVINVYFYAILLRVILSWFMPYGIRQNPAGDLLVSLTEPLMRPARRLIPPVGGLDLSPIVALVGLQLMLLALAHLLR